MVKPTAMYIHGPSHRQPVLSRLAPMQCCNRGLQVGGGVVILIASALFRVDAAVGFVG